jgi:hypothetical protein
MRFVANVVEDLCNDAIPILERRHPGPQTHDQGSRQRGRQGKGLPGTPGRRFQALPNIGRRCHPQNLFEFGLDPLHDAGLPVAVRALGAVRKEFDLATLRVL